MNRGHSSDFMAGLRNCLIVVSLASCLLCSCNQRHGVVEVRLVATAGLHGQIYSDDPLTGIQREMSAARLSSFLKQQRSDNANLVYADAGDLLCGSAETYHDRSAVFDMTDISALAMNALECDAVVFGDGDFSLSAESMYNFYNACNATVLCADMGYLDCGDFFPPYVTVVRHGVRITLIGLTSYPMDSYVPADIIQDMVFDEPVRIAARWLPVIREKENPDVVVAVLHNGTDMEMPARLASQVPGIDLIVCSDGCGKEMETVITGQDTTQVAFISSGESGGVSVASITVDFSAPGTPAISVSAHRTNLSGFAPDTDFEKFLASRRRNLDNYLDSTIGTLGSDLDFRGAYWRPSTGVGMVHKYQKRHHAAQISLAAVPAPGQLLKRGEFKGRDAFTAVPSEEHMVSVMMRGHEVKSVLEYSLDQYLNTVTDPGDRLLKLENAPDGHMALKPADMPMVSASGIVYEVDITESFGERVSILSMSDGTDFDPEREYRTTMAASLFSRATSPVAGVPGIDLADIAHRLNMTSMADLRYHLISGMFISTESGTPLEFGTECSWRLIPESLAASCLARDTVDIFY